MLSYRGPTQPRLPLPANSVLTSMTQYTPNGIKQGSSDYLHTSHIGRIQLISVSRHVRFHTLCTLHSVNDLSLVISCPSRPSELPVFDSCHGQPRSFCMLQVEVEGVVTFIGSLHMLFFPRRFLCVLSFTFISCNTDADQGGRDMLGRCNLA